MPAILYGQGTAASIQEGRSAAAQTYRSRGGPAPAIAPVADEPRNALADLKRQIPAGKEWNCPVAPATAGTFSVKVEGKGPFSILLLADRSYQALMKGNAQGMNKSDVLLDVQGPGPKYTGEVKLPQGTRLVHHRRTGPAGRATSTSNAGGWAARGQRRQPAGTPLRGRRRSSADAPPAARETHRRSAPPDSVNPRPPIHDNTPRCRPFGRGRGRCPSPNEPNRRAQPDEPKGTPTGEKALRNEPNRPRPPDDRRGDGTQRPAALPERTQWTASSPKRTQATRPGGLGRCSPRPVTVKCPSIPPSRASRVHVPRAAQEP